MSFFERVLGLLWKGCEVNDQKRLSKQVYPNDLVEINDVEYICDGHKYHKLDIYYPQGTKKGAKLPVIIDIHGGGWFYGDKELNKNYNLHLAQRGFVVFNISYRLAPKVRIKEQMQDVMSALKFIGEHLRDYPCDKKRVYLTGDSAGGQLAAFAGAACKSKKIRSAYDCVNADIDIKAIGLTSPVPYLMPKGIMAVYTPHVLGDWKGTEYENFIDFDKLLDECDDDPPTIIFSSIMDVVALMPSRRAYKDLKHRGYKVKLDVKYNPTLMHVYQVLDPESGASVKAINKMVKFFVKNK